MVGARRVVLAAGVCLTLTLAADSAQPVANAWIRQATHARPELAALYDAETTPLWTDASGAVTPSARDALRLLADASADGLNPDDYGLERLRAVSRQLEQHPSSEVVAQFDVWMSDAVLTYLRHLLTGRGDPRRVDLTFTFAGPTRASDLPARVRRAIAERQLVGLVHAVRPRTPQYSSLGWALARYRAAAAAERLVPLPFTAAVHPGEPYRALDALRQRLALLGDLSMDATMAESTVYDGAVVDAVIRFQRRHGLEADGVLGAKTIEQLSVPLSTRVRHIELAMERLRWLPREPDTRTVLVNIPTFTLQAWDGAPASGTATFTSSVIVGRAGKTETPNFDAVMTDILFRPYWNVPRSIVRNEVLPTLAKQPDYLQRERMELVDGDRDESPVVETTAANLARLAQGRLRLRQRPGPTNALGLIKFLFPNPHDVYMHATPAPSLFARSRRDFSHGCVRVKDPVGLAEWVLSGQDAWTRPRIVSAMEQPSSSRVAIARPVRVILFYSTADVDLSTGDVTFATDIYRRDAALDRVMREPALHLPEPESARVHMHEVGGAVIADAATTRGERSLP